MNRNIPNLRATIDNLLKQLDDIRAGCIQENREYSDEEKKLIGQIQKRVEALREQIELEEKGEG
jgi:peptidoglycan hydrolase CwlO-like protein